MINKNWFETKEINCPNIKEDTSYEMTENRHNVTFVTKLNRDKIYEDLFNKLEQEMKYNEMKQAVKLLSKE